MDIWRVCRPFIAALQHFDKQQDPDPHHLQPSFHLKQRKIDAQQILRGTDTDTDPPPLYARDGR